MTKNQLTIIVQPYSNSGEIKEAPHSPVYIVTSVLEACLFCHYTTDLKCATYCTT